MTTDKNAELAHEEMFNLAAEVQSKQHVSNQTMNYICADLAQCYAIKAIAERELIGGGLDIRWPGKDDD